MYDDNDHKSKELNDDTPPKESLSQSSIVGLTPGFGGNPSDIVKAAGAALGVAGGGAAVATGVGTGFVVAAPSPPILKYAIASLGAVGAVYYIKHKQVQGNNEQNSQAELIEETTR